MTHEEIINLFLSFQDNLLESFKELKKQNVDVCEKISALSSKVDSLTEQNKKLESQVLVTENTSSVLEKNFSNCQKDIVKLEKKLHQMEQYSRRECLEITGIPSTVNNNSLEQYLIENIFKKIDVNIGKRDIAACHRLRDSTRVIVKFINRKDAESVMYNKHEIRKWKNYNKQQEDASSDVTDSQNQESKSNSIIYINNSLCPYYRYLYGLVKDRFYEEMIDDFKVVNGIIKIKEPGSVKFIPILHETDL